MSLLEVENCTICYQGGAPAVSGLSLHVEEGEIVSLVGESGSGKTTFIRALLGLLPPGGKVTGGSMLFQGRDLAKLSDSEMQALRGKEIAMIFQDVGAALDPIQKIRTQYGETIRMHERLPRHIWLDKARGMLGHMQLSDPDRVLDSYPFELSGGMKQRVGIAMSMTARPRLLLADEPTSALDVTIQAQVVHRIRQLREEYGAAIILVTHNMGVASYLSDNIGVMHNSHLVEYGPRDEIIYHPRAAYTRSLLEAVPKIRGKRIAR